MSDILVRPIASSEIPSAVRVVMGGFGAPEFEDPTDTAAYEAAVVATRASGGEVLVAVAGDEVVGVCQRLVLPHFQHRGGRCAEVESVHVREDWRRKGVGAALFREIEVRARAAGCYRIQLTNNCSRDVAHDFYPALGFAASHVGYKKHLDEPST